MTDYNSKYTFVSVGGIFARDGVCHLAENCQLWFDSEDMPIEMSHETLLEYADRITGIFIGPDKICRQQKRCVCSLLEFVICKRPNITKD